jgi:hypothetical protein
MAPMDSFYRIIFYPITYILSPFSTSHNPWCLDSRVNMVSKANFNRRFHLPVSKMWNLRWNESLSVHSFILQFHRIILAFFFVPQVSASSFTRSLTQTLSHVVPASTVAELPPTLAAGGACTRDRRSALDLTAGGHETRWSHPPGLARPASSTSSACCSEVWCFHNKRLEVLQAGAW